jgi:hypothetical protein
MLLKARWSRIAAVTTGLAFGGAIVGAVAATIAMVILIVARLGIGYLPRASALLPFTAISTAAAGFVAFPTASWLLLRRVRIGVALAATGLCTIVGSLFGEWIDPFNPYSYTIPGLVRGAVVGFVVGVVLLRLASGQFRIATKPYNER